MPVCDSGWRSLVHFHENSGPIMTEESKVPKEMDLVSQSSHWYAAQTMSRHEKKVSAELNTKEICSFLPLVSQRKRWSDRYRLVEEPLFAGYVFVRLAWE